MAQLIDYSINLAPLAKLFELIAWSWHEMRASLAGYLHRTRTYIYPSAYLKAQKKPKTEWKHFLIIFIIKY